MLGGGVTVYGGAWLQCMVGAGSQGGIGVGSQGMVGLGQGTIFLHMHIVRGRGGGEEDIMVALTLSFL